MNDYDKDNYNRAKKRLKDVKEFYSHLIVYVVINLMLFIINLVFTRGIWWFWFPLIFWGIGLLFHFLGIFVFGNKVFGKKWEEKKIKEYMEEDQ